MRFTIQEIGTADGDVFVTGKTHCGTIKGLWKSQTIKPVSGRSYNIELTFGINMGAIDRSEIMIESDQAEADISITGDRVRFIGLCESIDDIYFMRFSIDGLEMLDIENDDDTIKEGSYLSFSLPFEEIGIYPY